MDEMETALAEAEALEKKRYTREEAWGVYKDTEAKLADRKRRLHLITSNLRELKDWKSLQAHPMWKKLMESAEGVLSRGRPVRPHEPGYETNAVYEMGRRDMLEQFKLTLAAQCGESEAQGDQERWEKHKAELQKEISTLEKLLVDSKAAYDKILAVS